MLHPGPASILSLLDITATSVSCSSPRPRPVLHTQPEGACEPRAVRALLAQILPRSTSLLVKAKSLALIQFVSCLIFPSLTLLQPPCYSSAPTPSLRISALAFPSLGLVFCPLPFLHNSLTSFRSSFPYHFSGSFPSQLLKIAASPQPHCSYQHPDSVKA